MSGSCPKKPSEETCVRKQPKDELCTRIPVPSRVFTFEGGAKLTTGIIYGALGGVDVAYRVYSDTGGKTDAEIAARGNAALKFFREEFDLTIADSKNSACMGPSSCLIPAWSGEGFVIRPYSMLPDLQAYPTSITGVNRMPGRCARMYEVGWIFEVTRDLTVRAAGPFARSRAILPNEHYLRRGACSFFGDYIIKMNDDRPPIWVEFSSRNASFLHQDGEDVGAATHIRDVSSCSEGKGHRILAIAPPPLTSACGAPPGRDRGKLKWELTYVCVLQFD